MDLDARVRVSAFTFLAEQTRLLGEVLPRTLLSRGFSFEGRQVRLMGPQGIFKPAILPELPLTITTVPTVEGRERPYEDEIGENGLIVYRYRGTNPDHHENVGRRTATARQTPLIHFIGVVPSKYMALWPVFIVGDDPASLSFTVAVEDRDSIAVATQPRSFPTVTKKTPVCRTRRRRELRDLTATTSGGIPTIRHCIVPEPQRTGQRASLHQRANAAPPSRCGIDETLVLCSTENTIHSWYIVVRADPKRF